MLLPAAQGGFLEGEALGCLEGEAESQVRRRRHRAWLRFIRQELSTAMDVAAPRLASSAEAGLVPSEEVPVSPPRLW